MLTIEELKEKFLKGEYESDIYSSVNENGETVIVMMQKGVGFDIHTNQSNGWVRVDSFSYDKESGVWDIGEAYEGKWK